MFHSCASLGLLVRAICRHARGLFKLILVIDRSWMKAYDWCSFQFDDKSFPDPAGYLRSVKDKYNVKVCVWINPYICEYPNGRAHAMISTLTRSTFQPNELTSSRKESRRDTLSNEPTVMFGSEFETTHSFTSYTTEPFALQMGLVAAWNGIRRLYQPGGL